MSTEEFRNQIRAALKKLGPTSPMRITDSIGADVKKVGYHMRAMLAAGELKVAGTSIDRVYALPDQKLDGAKPTPPGGRKKKPGRRAAAAPRTPRARPAAPLFLPAFTEDQRLVLVEDGGHTIFNPEQTLAIANLLLEHFEAS